MRHPLDRPIGTALSQQVLEARRLRGELGLQSLDSVNRRLYALPCALVQREAFMADRVLDEGDCAQPGLPAGRTSTLDLSLTPLGERKR